MTVKSLFLAGEVRAFSFPRTLMVNLERQAIFWLPCQLCLKASSCSILLLGNITLTLAMRLRLQKGPKD